VIKYYIISRHHRYRCCSLEYNMILSLSHLW